MSDVQFNKIALIGIGLIGSSIARAVKEKHLANEVSITTRSAITLARAEELGVQILLPGDIVVDTAFPSGDRTPEPRVVPASEIPADCLGLDIGPAAAADFAAALADARTVFWNGPMGVFEVPQFSDGTRAVADALTRTEGLSVVGGGDSAAAVRSLGFDEAAFGHISTGGGASLEYLEGKTLPGIDVLEG